MTENTKKEPRYFTYTDGDLKGWSTFAKSAAKNLDNDPAEDLLGPFYFRTAKKGGAECMFIPTPRHNNNGGFTHGGVLMTFADFALFAHTQHLRNGPAVTVQFESQFITPSKPGLPLFSRGEVIRNTKDLIFVRGIITQDNIQVLSYSGIIKRVASRLI